MNTNMMELNLNEMEMVNGGTSAEDHYLGAITGMTFGGLGGLAVGSAIGGVVGGVPGACVGGQIGCLTGMVGGAVAGGIVGVSAIGKAANGLINKILSIF